MNTQIACSAERFYFRDITVANWLRNTYLSEHLVPACIDASNIGFRRIVSSLFFGFISARRFFGFISARFCFCLIDSIAKQSLQLTLEDKQIFQNDINLSGSYLRRW